MTLLIPLFSLLTGCAPPEAPEELNELTAFIFEHAQDVESTEIEQGVLNLEAWMSKRLEETKDGYEVDNLTTDSVGELDQCTRDITGLIGAAVGTTSRHSADELIELWLAGNLMDLYDSLIAYERDVLHNDVECFLSHECETLHYDSYSTKKFALGIEVEAVSRAQWRWVELDDGYAAVQRTWLALPMQASPAWLDVEEQFYLSVMMPRKNNKSVRMQAIWAVTEIDNAPVPEGIALGLAIDQMKSDAETSDEWLNNH